MKEEVLRGVCLVWLLMSLSLVADDVTGSGADGLKRAGEELKYEEPKHLNGTIYTPDRKKVLFKFTRTASRSGSTLNVQRDYTYPDSRPAAREKVVYEGDTLVSYELEESQTGGAGSVHLRRATDNPTKDSLEFAYSDGPGSRPKTRTEALRENTLMADMVGPFLQSHWEALWRGDKLKCRYIVIPRRETVGFTFVKDSQSSRQGREVLIVKMEATSPFVATQVDPLFFALALAPPHHVLEYAGRTTPKIQVGGKWKDLDALTVFDWGSPP